MCQERSQSRKNAKKLKQNDNSGRQIQIDKTVINGKLYRRKKIYIYVCVYLYIYI